MLPSARNHHARQLTTAVIHLDRLSHNLRVLQREVGDRPLWPAIKANAYGHGAEIVARHLTHLGYDTLCVAHVPEAALVDLGVRARHLRGTIPLGCAFNRVHHGAMRS